MAICRFRFYFLISLITVLANVQTATTTIALSISDSNKILNILKDIENGEGTFSNLKISNTYVSAFTESADYGPTWHGNTINVNQSGYLIQYEYEQIDSISNKTSKWESSESIFIPYDKSAIYRMYTCRFGNIPPSFGYANRRKEWDNKYEKIVSILNKKENESLYFITI